MNGADVNIISNEIVSRMETSVPGGTVITVRTAHGVRYRARNLLGVMLRDGLSVIEWSSFADAEAELRRFAAGEAPSAGDADGEAVGDAVRAPMPPTDRTLDDYHQALSEVDTKGSVPIHVVARKIYGIRQARAMRDDTKLALEELVEQGRADRDIGGRYRARLSVTMTTSSTTAAAILASSQEDDEDDYSPLALDDEDRALLGVACGPPRRPVIDDPHDGAEGEKTSPSEILDHDMIAPDDLAECVKIGWAEWDCTAGDGLDDDESAVGSYVAEMGTRYVRVAGPVGECSINRIVEPTPDPEPTESSSWVRAVSVINRERHLHETREQRIDELRRAETDLRAMADEAKRLLEEVFP